MVYSIYYYMLKGAVESKDNDRDRFTTLYEVRSMMKAAGWINEDEMFTISAQVRETLEMH